MIISIIYIYNAKNTLTMTMNISAKLDRFIQDVDMMSLMFLVNQAPTIWKQLRQKPHIMITYQKRTYQLQVSPTTKLKAKLYPISRQIKKCWSLLVWDKIFL